MFSDNHKNQACEFAEETLAYLYGEMAGAEKARFEAHLAGCAACTDDAAGFNVVRSSIREWRGLEFDHLSVPAIALPAAEIPSRPALSRLEAIRAYFSVSPWMTATASLAILAIFAGLAAVFYNRSSESPLAVNVNQNSATSARSPIVENPQPISAFPENAKREDESQSALAAQSKPVKVLPEDPRPTRKASLSVKSAPRAAQPGVPNMTKQVRNGKIAPRNAKQPTLAGSDDDEDTSLRLADIFEEISMR